MKNNKFINFKQQNSSLKIHKMFYQKQTLNFKNRILFHFNIINVLLIDHNYFKD